MRAKLPMHSGKLNRGDATLHYDIYGSGKQTLLFVPTWAIIHSRGWKAQVPYFSDHYRVITYDPRGNGMSSRPDSVDAYSFDRIVEDVNAIMDETETPTATLVGHSFSSAVIFAFAARYPERVDALVSICGWSPIVKEHAHRDYDQALVDNPEGWQKFNGDYWETNYPDFVRFFMSQVFTEQHSTKQQQDSVAWALDSNGTMLCMTQEARADIEFTEDTYKQTKCPTLIVYGDDDQITPPEMSIRIAELTQGEIHCYPQGGHALHARYPAWFNLLMRDFLARHLRATIPSRNTLKPTAKRALYLSSPIGLGHARRDLAITRELRSLQPDLHVDWLAQDPVTRFLQANQESIHKASALLANESAHIEEEAGEHDLNAFQAIRNMDEILVKNFMVFQEVLESDHYDLVIADEAWDIDHYWHEHPQLKNTQIAWLTDFVGWVPFEHNGSREAFLTADYNAEMIGHVEQHPEVRDRAVFVGNPEDIIDLSFGENLPRMRDWIPEHFEFSDYILGRHPSEFGSRSDLRAELGYDDGRKHCIVSVGGSGVGANLIRRVLQAYPIAKRKIPDLHMIVVTGPRLDGTQFDIPDGVDVHEFIPDLDRLLAACDLALVQGGLTTCMELTAAGTPFLYFPLQNHFEQNFHVHHRLEQYNAGRKMEYARSGPEQIAEAMIEELHSPRIPLPVANNGASKAANMLAEML